MALAHDGSPLGVVTLSIGVAQSAFGQPTNTTDLFEKADTALYTAKRLGRNRVGETEHTKTLFPDDHVRVDVDISR
jgi:PleD family two-component response regulator